MKTIESEKTDEKGIIHKGDDQDRKRGLTDIRGAIVAPDRLNSTPGYYLLLGKLKGEDSDDIPELIFLTEVEEASSKALFEKLVEDEEEFRFSTIYTGPYQIGTGIAPPDFILSLHRYVKRPEHIPWIRICPASFFYGNDIKQGVDLLDQWPKDNYRTKIRLQKYQYCEYA